jgi:predicted RecA/RadA family phage recombinase
MKNYVQDGDRLTYTNGSGSTITSGTGVLVGLRVGIATADIANGAIGTLAMEGVFTLPKLSTDVVAQGALLYWDNTNKRLTVTTTSNTLCGYAQTAAGAATTTVDIMLNR